MQPDWAYCHSCGYDPNPAPSDATSTEPAPPPPPPAPEPEPVSAYAAGPDPNDPLAAVAPRAHEDLDDDAPPSAPLGGAPGFMGGAAVASPFDAPAPSAPSSPFDAPTPAESSPFTSAPSYDSSSPFDAPAAPTGFDPTVPFDSTPLDAPPSAFGASDDPPPLPPSGGGFSGAGGDSGPPPYDPDADYSSTGPYAGGAPSAPPVPSFGAAPPAPLGWEPPAGEPAFDPEPMAGGGSGGSGGPPGLPTLNQMGAPGGGRPSVSQLGPAVGPPMGGSQFKLNKNVAIIAVAGAAVLLVAVIVILSSGGKKSADTVATASTPPPLGVLGSKPLASDPFAVSTTVAGGPRDCDSANSTHSAYGKDYTPCDAYFSIDFPGRPDIRPNDQNTQMGKITVYQLTSTDVAIEPPVQYRVAYAELPKEPTPEEATAIENEIIFMMSGTAGPGRDFGEFPATTFKGVDGKLKVSGFVFARGNHVYALAAASETPADKQLDELASTWVWR